MATLHLVRGKPGSGKSTFAQKSFPGVLLLENDMFHMHDGVYDWHAENMKDAVSWCASMVETALENEIDVVVANTFTKRRYIDFYRKLAEKWTAKFKVYRCTSNFQNVHGLTEDMVKNFESSMEDWPGETILQPEPNAKMTCEVFDLSTNEIHGQFPSIMQADSFLDGIAGTSLAAQVQIRTI